MAASKMLCHRSAIAAKARNPPFTPFDTNGPELPFMLIALDYCYQLKADMIPPAAHAGMPRKKGSISTFDAVAKPKGVRILGFLLIIRKQQYTRVTFWCQNRCTLSPSGDAYPEILA